ncbi:MAG: hypothetical protein FWG65_09560 [Turicibacter sp.]|nr:hypothetical protein [Turicibacter sp.]
MNVTVNNNNHQINFALGQNGVIRAGLDDNEKKTFSEFRAGIEAKAQEDEAWNAVIEIFKLPELFAFQAESRVAAFDVFTMKLELGNDGNFAARQEIIGLFSQFGLDRFLQPGLNVIEAITNMSPAERTAFIRMRDYIVDRGLGYARHSVDLSTLQF